MLHYLVEGNISMELIILSLAAIKVLYPVIMLIITALFIAYVIKHRNNSAKVRQATQILFYLSTSMYYLSRVLKVRR